MEREPAPGKRRWSVYRTPREKSGETREVLTPAASTPAPKPASKPVARPARTSRVGVGIAVGLVGVVAAAVIGFSAVVSALTDSDGVLGDDEVQVLTEDGMAGLVDAIEDETGRTEVFSATIYPTYAVVQVPADASSRRYIGYHWDGHDLEEWAGKGTSSNERVDLADVDPSVLLPLVEKMKARIEDPNSWYVIIDHTGDDGWISAYASNEYSEGGYIEVDLEGDEVRRASWPTEP